MRLKARLDKLEPGYGALWSETWERALGIDETEVYIQAERRLFKRIDALSDAERKRREADLKDQERDPLLLAWNAADLMKWSKRFDAWLGERGFTWDTPDFALWPWQAPAPPEVPGEVLAALREAANEHGDYAARYAYRCLRAVMGEGVRAAIRAHEGA